MAMAAAMVVMITAAVITAMMLLAVVMVAGGALGEDQGAVQQLFHALVGAAHAAGVQADAGLGQCDLGTGADAAADEAVHAVCQQEVSQRAVAAAHGGNDFCALDGTVFDFIQLESRSVAKVAVYISVFVSNSDFHETGSFLLDNTNLL